MSLNWGLDVDFSDASVAHGFLAFPMFLQRVTQELTIAGLLKYPYTLVAMTIDEAKELDLKKGMGFGAMFVQQLGHSLSGALRSQPTEVRSEVDVVAQYEQIFLFSFPNTDFNDAMVPMRRVIDMARAEAMRAVADPDFLLPIACGILTWEPASGPIGPADFVYRTIEALYQAKKDSPNKLYLFRMGLKDENPDLLRIKHNQTAPLKLKSRPNVSGLLAAGQPAGAERAAAPEAAPRKSKKSKKKKKKGFSWKFW
ncbi:MAG: hypothetical protein FJX47_08450 [Alphaproteobacteria bacterium]|nr:hypothetical protein [Alphaproteobacteria bacterium]